MKKIKKAVITTVLMMEKKDADDTFLPCECGEALPTMKTGGDIVYVVAAVEKVTKKVLRYKCPHCKAVLRIDEGEET